MTDDKVIHLDARRWGRRSAGGGDGGDGDGLAGRVAAIERRMDGIETRLASVEDRLTRVEVKLDAVDKRFDAIERRMDDLRIDLRRLEDRMLTKWDVAQVMLIVIAGVSGAAFVLPRLAALLAP